MLSLGVELGGASDRRVQVLALPPSGPVAPSGLLAPPLGASVLIFLSVEESDSCTSYSWRGSGIHTGGAGWTAKSPENVYCLSVICSYIQRYRDSISGSSMSKIPPFPMSKTQGREAGPPHPRQC